MLRLAWTVALLALLAGCGGISSPAAGGSNPPPASGGSSSPTSPAPVTVTAGQVAANVNIQVPPPSSTTPPNLEDLGAGNDCGVSNACNTGDVIHRGATAQLLLFGPGLTADMQLSVSGPDDIVLGAPTATKSTSGTPGLRLTATVNGKAALGARTLILRAPNGDITTFAGGLEVVP